MLLVAKYRWIEHEWSISSYHVRMVSTSIRLVISECKLRAKLASLIVHSLSFLTEASLHSVLFHNTFLLTRIQHSEVLLGNIAQTVD